MAAILTLTILMSVLSISCLGEQKYSYEEYKKIKAMTTDKDSEDTAEDLLMDDNDKLQSFSKDLNDYYLYTEEFKSIYDKHTSELFILFDDFDGEKEDINKKNQYADSIIEHEERWIADLEEIAVPDLLDNYHICFVDYLNNEVLFYKYFLEADLEKGVLKNVTQGYEESFPALPPVMTAILAEGGLVPYVQKHGDLTISC